MAGNVYKVIELVGTSNESREKAAAATIEVASKTLRDIRVARIVEQDIHTEPGKPLAYRVKSEKRSQPTACAASRRNGVRRSWRPSATRFACRLCPSTPTGIDLSLRGKQFGWAAFPQLYLPDNALASIKRIS